MHQPGENDVQRLMRTIGELSESQQKALLDELGSKIGGTASGLGVPATVFVDAPDRADATEDAPGSVIGRYKLLEPLGEGGFGAVFVAEQSEPVRRRVAIKILKRGMDTQRVVARFEAERQALAMMDHPGIAKVLDAGQTPSGRPFVVMELVRGEPITTFCDNAKTTIEGRVRLLRAVCAAVQHAHQKGIIHRDLKPSNVLVSLQDGEPVPKVIDFGVAKAIHGRLGEETVYTKIHQMIGTPVYMSPEQSGAGGLDVDTRTDIYALGVLAYEVLAGVTPFDARRLAYLGVAEIQQLLLNETPPRPSARVQALTDQRDGIAAARATDARRLVRRLSGDLDWIVMKCLEKDRARRYESAHALDEDLTRHLADEPVKAGPPSATYLAGRFIRRHQAHVSAFVAIFLLLVLGLGGTMIAWSRASEQSARLRFTLEFFTNALAGASDDAASLAIWNDRPELTLGEALRSAEGLIDETFAHEPQLEAIIRELIGLAQLRAGEFDDAARQLARAASVRSALSGDTDPETLRLLLPLADAQSKTGDFEGSIATATRAYDRGAAALGAAHPETRATALWLARWFAAAYKFDDAERYFELATHRIEGVADARDPITLAATIESCGVLTSKGRLDRAEEILRATEPRIANLPASMETISSRLDRQLNMVLILRGEAEEAIQRLGAAVRNAPDTDRYRARLLAWALARAGRTDEAEALFTQLLDLERRAPGPAFREIFARVYLADALLEAGRAAEALAHIEPALRRYDALGLPNDPDRLWAKSILGRAMLETGDTEGAGRALREASETDRLFPEHRLYVPAIRLAHARWLRATGADAEARAELSEALEEARAIYGPGDSLVRQLAASLGE